MQLSFIHVSVYLFRDFGESRYHAFLFHSSQQVDQFTEDARRLAELAGYTVHFVQIPFGEIQNHAEQKAVQNVIRVQGLRSLYLDRIG